MDEIDAVDYSILACVDRHGKAWKKKAHACITENQKKFPGNTDISLQTVGRRMDDLHEEGLLETRIISPDGMNRDLMIGYVLTDNGYEAMTAQRERFLKEMVMDASEAMLYADKDTDFSISREALIELMCAELDIDDTAREDIVEQSSMKELTAVLMEYYFRKNAARSLDEAAEDRIATLILDTPKLRDAYTIDIISERIRQRLAHTDASFDGTVWKQVDADDVRRQ